jgi:isoleucyl-tRNA synthetase
MDVWFDSGTSWRQLFSRADIYLEGTDQHRGWFQSSLLTSVATRGDAPFKTLITHGFVLDKEMVKMSKSVGNVISPKDIVGKGVGVDGLRMWVASAEYTTDVVANETVFRHILGGLQKIRATLRFLIGNLYRADILDIQYSDLSKVSLFGQFSRQVDQYALHHVFEINRTVKQHYDNFEFFRGIFHGGINRSCASSTGIYRRTPFTKLFFRHKRYSLLRRRKLPSSTCGTVRPLSGNPQETINKILLNYLSMISPLIPLYAEEAWDFTPSFLKREDAVYKMGWFKPPQEWCRNDLAANMQILESLKEKVLGILEKARQKQYIRENFTDLDSLGILSKQIWLLWCREEFKHMNLSELFVYL